MATESTQTGRRASGLHAWELEAELQPGEPPPAVVRLVTWLIIVLFLVSVAAALLVRVPETVRSPFVLVSEKGADPIQAPLLAVVDKVCVREGDEVAAGALLFVLRSDEVRNWQTQLQTYREDQRALQERGRRLDEAHASLVKIKKMELEQVEQQLNFRVLHAEVSSDYVRRMESLSAEVLVPVELIKSQLELAESLKELNVIERTRQQVTLDLARMELERARQRSEEQAEAAKLTVRIAALEQRLVNTEGDLLQIRAPYGANVISLAQRNAGSVVPTGGTLCELTPLEGRPRARLLLPEEALSQINPEQSVRLFFGAFPYQRHGTVTGQVEWVSPAAVAMPTGAHFVAMVSLGRTNLRSRGIERPLRVGMKGEARVTVGTNTLAQYAVEPLRSLRENMRD